MKAKKIVVFLVIILLIGAGSYFFQKNKQEKALKTHNKAKFQQVMTAAQKSPSAGLLLMASAINKYQKLKGQYPKELIQLFPEFIPDKSFITTLGWAYETGKGTYKIERYSGQQFFAMGPDMSLKTGRKKDELSSRSIASVKPQKKPKASSALAADKSSSKTKMDVKKDSTVQTVPTVKKNIVKSTGNIKKSSSTTTPEVIVKRSELSKDEKFLLFMNSKNLYIWKSNSGVIGFSNIQYPDEKDLTIYENKSWVTYQYDNKSGN